jgi:F0F1-type ATP synthase membrane subunit b/b'
MAIEDIPVPRLNRNELNGIELRIQQLRGVLNQSFSGNANWRAKESYERQLKTAEKDFADAMERAKADLAERTKEYERECERELERMAEEERKRKEDEKRAAEYRKHCTNPISALEVDLE